MKYVLNIAKNAFIDIISFELFYEIKFFEMLKLLTFFTKSNNNVVDFLARKTQFRNKIYDNIKLTQIKMTLFFDDKHCVFNFIDFVYLKLTKIDCSKYHVFDFSFIFVKKIELFRILKRVSDLIYRFEIFKFFRIHDVVFVIYLEQATFDSFFKNISSFSFLIIEKKNFYVIKKILKKKQQEREIDYVIK